MSSLQSQQRSTETKMSISYMVVSMATWSHPCTLAGLNWVTFGTHEHLNQRRAKVQTLPTEQHALQAHAYINFAVSWSAGRLHSWARLGAPAGSWCREFEWPAVTVRIQKRLATSHACTFKSSWRFTLQVVCRPFFVLRIPRRTQHMALQVVPGFSHFKSCAAYPSNCFFFFSCSLAPR